MPLLMMEGKRSKEISGILIDISAVLKAVIGRFKSILF
jgi:hypothetical protein